MSVSFALLVPVRNAERYAKSFLEAVKAQTVHANRMIAIDSEFSDRTAELFRDGGFEAVPIKASSFDHGGTRQQAADLAGDEDVLVFMTQDSILASPQSLEALFNPFKHQRHLGAVCGRQMRSPGANPFAVYARNHNYPTASYERSNADFPQYGIKTAFMSNSFAAYRKSALEAAGGFPKRSIFGEDLLVAAKMMLTECRIRYEAEATVYHSHNYSLSEEFRRYFDVGVMRSTQNAILSQLGAANTHARKMLVGETKYLAKRHPWLVPLSVARAGVRFAAYQLGKRSGRMPVSLCRRLSFCPSYWRQTGEQGI